jgi:hypothetical protein
VFAFDKSTEAALQGYAVGQVGNLRRVGNPLRRLSRLPTGAQDGILPHTLYSTVFAILARLVHARARSPLEIAALLLRHNHRVHTPLTTLEPKM